MPLSDATRNALAEAGVAVQESAPLLKRTWWRVGGPADGLVQADDLPTLAAVQRIASTTGSGLFVLGNASNLLVSDAGIRGLVVRLGGELAGASVSDGVAVLGGGMKLVPLVGRMVRDGWTGLELFAGIPGTVGGAVRMNAGTTLGEVVDRLLDVDVVLPDGSIRTVQAGDLRMSYRTCHLPDGAIVASARFQLTEGDPAVSRAHVEEHLARRKATQPIDMPSCGSTFRNPDGDAAGRLIEACGLKSFAIGGAMVSPKHANFLVNTGDATAADLRALLEHVRDEVLRRHGVLLEQEVHFAGDWDGWPGG